MLPLLIYKADIKQVILEQRIVLTLCTIVNTIRIWHLIIQVSLNSSIECAKERYHK